MTDKVLSFIVPAYNSEATLKQCLDSLLVPDAFGQMEVFVINDGSTDDTASIAQSYAEKYPCLHLINKKNGGHGSVINEAVNLVSGKYFKVIDSDDLIKSENLMTFISALEIFNTDAVFTHFRMIDTKNNHSREYCISGVDFGCVYSFADYWKHKQNVFLCCCFHGITYNTEFYRSCNIKLSEKISYEDQEYATLPFAYVKNVVPLDIFLYEYNMGDPNQSMSDENQVKHLAHRKQILWKLLDATTPNLPEAAADYFMFKTRELLLGFFMAALIKNPNKSGGRQIAQILRHDIKTYGAISLLKSSQKPYIICLAISYLGRFGNKLSALRRIPIIGSLALRIRRQNVTQQKTRLAFYGWTDYLLLNLVNAKESHHPNEPADLFIFKLNRVSAELIEAIRKNCVFDNIYVLQPYNQIDLTSSKDKIMRLLSGRKYYRFYAQQIESFIGDTKYHAFFTGAFWSETLHILRYLFKANHKMAINFVEEGTASYLDNKLLQRCIPRGGIREIIFRYMHYAKSYKRACKGLNKIYVYSRQLKASSDNVLLLYPINETVKTKQILRDVSEGIEIQPYINSKFYYCVSPIDTYEENQVILTYINSSELLIIPHPDIIGEKTIYKEGLYVKTSPILIEAIFSRVDIKDKVLISKDSSVLMTPKLLFNIEPYVIMTYRLYTNYKTQGNMRADLLFKQINEIYSDNSRVFVPKTLDELKAIITNLSEDLNV